MEPDNLKSNGETKKKQKPCMLRRIGSGEKSMESVHQSKPQNKQRYMDNCFHALK